MMVVHRANVAPSNTTRSFDNLASGIMLFHLEAPIRHPSQRWIAQTKQSNSASLVAALYRFILTITELMHPSPHGPPPRALII